MNDETPLVLAIDTSTEQSGIALFDRACLDEVAWSRCTDHTVNLLSEVDHLLSRWDREVSSLEGVAVAVGPGRFNSLRVGMSVAKGLVLGLGIPIVGISTLDATAWPYLVNDQHVYAVVSAGRKRIAWQRFELDGPGNRTADEVHHTEFEELRDAVALAGKRSIVTGELELDQIEALGPGAVPPRSGRLGRAGAIAELGMVRLLKGDTDDPVLLEPVYLHSRPSSSVTT